MTAREQRLLCCWAAEDAGRAPLTRSVRHLDMSEPSFKNTRVPGKKQTQEKHMETGESLYPFYKQ